MYHVCVEFGTAIPTSLHIKVFREENVSKIGGVHFWWDHSTLQTDVVLYNTLGYYDSVFVEGGLSPFNTFQACILTACYCLHICI